MKLITSLATEQFFTGIGLSDHVGSEGLFFSAPGVNPFINSNPESEDVGLLQNSAAPIDITSSVVVDIIRDGVTKITGATTGNLYMLGDNGHFYSKDLSNDNAPTDLRSGTPITSPANAIEIYKPQSGTEYLYYWQQSQIGRWDLSGSYPTGWTDNHFTGLQSTQYHPKNAFRGNVYYGNKDRIGMLYNNAGTAANNTNVLDYDADYTCTCLHNDGTYLVVGITKTVSGATVQGGESSKILFWDTINPDTWNHEWPFPDATINAIVPYEGGFIGYGQKNMYYFTFNTPPRLIRPLGNYAPRYGYPNTIDTFREAHLFGSGTTVINSYGKLTPSAPRAYFQPFAGLTGTPSYLNAKSKASRLYVATAQPKLYYYNLTSAGAASVTLAETKYLDFKGNWQLKMFDISLGEPLTTSDVCTISVQRDEDNAAIDWATISYASWGNARRLRLRNIYKANQLKLLFNFSAGNVKIKRIDIYGDRLRD